MADSSRREEIRAYCAARRIDTLLHFTRLENLLGILANGFLPRKTLDEQGSQAIVNDDYRIDGHRDAVCLSIGFPNYKMFYRHRQRERAATWTILLLRPDVLWELECAFYWANAAFSHMNKVPLAVLAEPSSLAKMFADACAVTGTSRLSCSIPDGYPANPQAEVLVLSRVPQSYVTEVHFESEIARSRFLLPRNADFRIRVDSRYFRPRCDYRVWSGSADARQGESWQDDPSSVPF